MGPRITRIDAKPAFAALRLGALEVGRSALDVFHRYENRTSFPGSISKSSTIESSVFGLITSSMNFT